ncbi:unnamed protein product, partial [Staurois parvus]
MSCQSAPAHYHYTVCSCGQLSSSVPITQGPQHSWQKIY